MWRYGQMGLLCLVLVIGVLACAPKRIGPTTQSGYFFSVAAPGLVMLHQRDTIVVRVQDAHGKPIDNVAVAFEIAPDWKDNATVSPVRATTQRGQAQTMFHAGLVGRVRVTVRVEDMSEAVMIPVSGRPSGP